MSKLRKTERVVLSKLETDARMPLSRLGKSIRQSQQQVNYTVNSLVKKGIIQNFHTMIDYSKLDILNFRVYFKISYINKEKFKELIRHLMADPHTSFVATCGGRCDLICTFLTLNPSQFNKTLKGLIAKFPKQLQNYDVLTTIVIRWFGRKYFEKNIHRERVFGGDQAPEKIDETDMKILNELSEDARMNSVEISGKVGLTSKSVIQRIKKLQKREIIVGFKPLLDPRKMGYTSTLLLIRYHNVSVELENELIKYLKAHPNVVSVVKTLGEWDIEVRVETPDPMEFRKVEMDIRQKFTLLIQQIESVPLYKTYKKKYFPRFLLK